jgi:hypothetical protein
VGREGVAADGLRRCAAGTVGHQPSPGLKCEGCFKLRMQGAL